MRKLSVFPIGWAIKRAVRLLHAPNYISQKQLNNNNLHINSIGVKPEKSETRHRWETEILSYF